MSAILHTHRTLAYLSPGSAGAKRRLLVLCHGVGGNETNLLPLAAHCPDDTAVVLVRGPLELGPGRHAWFEVTFGPDGPRPDLAEAERSRQRLATFIAELQAALGIAAQDTIVAGFSQGGILSASVALTRPELVAGFGVLAGRILPELEPRLADPARLQHLRAFIGHGRDDTKLPVDWAHRADAWLTRLGIAHETQLYPGDHGIPPQMAADFLRWQDALSPADALARLSLGGEETRIVGGAAGPEGRLLAPGIARLSRTHFTGRTSPALAIEDAIAAIEDDLATVPRALHGIALASDDPRLRDIARAAGLDDHDTVITRDAVEHVFTRLSFVATGRPAASEGLPTDAGFAAALLLVRELMHHLAIDRIHLDAGGHRAVGATHAAPAAGATQ